MAGHEPDPGPGRRRAAAAGARPGARRGTFRRHPSAAELASYRASLTPQEPPMVSLIRRIPHRVLLVLAVIAAIVGAPSAARAMAAVPAHPAAAAHQAAVLAHQAARP